MSRGMQIIRSVGELQAWADGVRRNGGRITFVPTMGYLHEGHAELMRAARRSGGELVVSIFVNPTQFGPNEDLDRYPRSPERDQALCEAEGASVLFLPEASEMYPAGAQTWVEVTGLSRDHSGADRPGHFRGVTTIVTKLFLAAKPHAAFFGEKDYQQLAVIRQMARDLNFDVEVVGVPTVREADGLALSSRNKYLSPEERRRALALSRGLEAARRAAEGGERDVGRLTGLVEDELRRVDADIDYVHLVDAATLERIGTLDGRAVILVAARIGNTRLIDNMTLPAPVRERA